MRVKERVVAILTRKTLVAFVLLLVFLLFALSLVANATLIISLMQAGEWWPLVRTQWYFLIGLLDAKNVSKDFLFLLTAGLFSLNTVFLIHYMRSIRGMTSASAYAGVSVLGSLSVLFGLHCISCAIILSTYAVPGIMYGFAEAFPFSGVGFVMIGSFLLLSSSALLFKKVTDPFVC